jgi:hypothetical protein
MFSQHQFNVKEFFVLALILTVGKQTYFIAKRGGFNEEKQNHHCRTNFAIGGQYFGLLPV